ncbi:YceI family protein [Paenalcaligenes hominis]|uniref:YceI family protein n=1 Tax=Paenalcaligenes hominis TaxID=643674 RepID=UPI003524B2E6
MKKKLTTLALLGGLLTSPFAWADWKVNDEQSHFSFLSVKAAKVGPDAATEVHRFKHIQGNLKKDGSFELSIPIKGLATGIEIRDERMMEMLFKESTYAAIAIKGAVDASQLSAHKAGQFKDIEVEAELTILDQTHPIKTTLRYTALDNDRFMVSTLNPIIINGNEFNLSEGLVSLREIAGLAFISHTVPVDFDLIFDPERDNSRP